MTSRTLRKDEGLALLAALLAHAGLFAWLAYQKPAPPPPLPDRMTVTLADDLGMTSTSPEPLSDPAPDSAPVLGDTPPPPEPEPAPLPRPEPKPATKPAIKPADKPAPKAQPSPRPTTSARNTPKQPPGPAQKNSGGSNLDDAYRTAPRGATGKDPSKTPPAAAPSAQVKSSWTSYIGDKVQRPWDTCAPNGLDAEKLRINVRFTLNRFGEIAAMQEPVVSGITDSNRPQAETYKQCAVRAIRVSAPFDNLPLEFYEHWKARNITFRKK